MRSPHYCRLLALGLGLWATGLWAQNPGPAPGPPPYYALPPVSAPGLEPIADDPAFAALERAFAAGQYERARGLAAKITAAARKRDGAGDPRLVTPLVDQATVEQYAGNYDQAIKTYNQAVKNLRGTGDSRDPRLVRPLFGLGVAAYDAGRYPQAVAALARAAFISRVHNGLKSPAQLRMYPGLIAAYTAVGAIDKAAARQQARLAIIEQNDNGGGDLSGAFDRAANWFHQMGRYSEERRLQRRHVTLLQNKHGNNDPVLVPVLKAIAGTFRPNNENGFEGLDMLRRAQRIQKNRKDTKPEALANTLVAIGDYYLSYDAPGSAIRRYRDALALLDGKDKADLRDRLQHPEPVYVPQPRPPDGLADPPPAGLPTGHVKLSFEVNRYGRPVDIRVVSVQPARFSKMAARARFALRDARFRPRVTAGTAITSDELHYSYSFHYPPAGGS